MPPANDNRADAIVVSFPIDITGTNVDATEEAGEPLPGQMGATIWYKFTVTEEGTVSVSLSGSDFDTYLAVYQEGSDTWLVVNDDSDGLQSAIVLEVSAGTYDCQVGGYNGDTGNVSLSGEFSIASVRSTIGTRSKRRRVHFE